MPNVISKNNLLESLELRLKHENLPKDRVQNIMHAVRRDVQAMNDTEYEEFVKRYDTQGGSLKKPEPNKITRAEMTGDGFLNDAELGVIVSDYNRAMSLSTPAPRPKHVPTPKKIRDELQEELKKLPRPQNAPPVLGPAERDALVQALLAFPKNGARKLAAVLILYAGKDAAQNQQELERIYRECETLIQDKKFREKLNFDEVNQAMKLDFGPDEIEIANRIIFGQGNEAGLTNLNCMPIVQLHGELAELGGEIPDVNRDWSLENDPAFKTLSLTQQDESMETLSDQLDNTHVNRPPTLTPPSSRGS